MYKFRDTALQLIRPPSMPLPLWDDLVSSVHRDLCTLGATDVRIDYLTPPDYIAYGARFQFDSELDDCGVIHQLLLDKYVDLGLLP